MSQQPVKIDGKQLFWDMAFQAYRVKAWYDVGQAVGNFGRVTIQSLPDLITFCVVVPVWVVAISLLLPYRVAQFVVRWGRWAYYIPHRKRVAQERYERNVVESYNAWKAYVETGSSEIKKQNNFSLDSFSTRFDQGV
jgi:hypothetical protein